VQTVHTAAVRPAGGTQARSFTGTLRAPLETALSFRVAGQVEDVLVDVGTRVDEGELIARLDPEDYRLRVESARAAHREAKAAAENARAELQRIKALYANDNASLSAYDRARTRYETARNRADAARQQRALARKRLGYTRLTAPADGAIADKLAQAGENVGVGQPVVRLTSGDRLEVKVRVSEGLIADLRVGQSASVQASALKEGRTDGPVPATVTEVGAATAGPRPTYPVVVTLDETRERLRSGMTARVTFDTGAADGLAVPAEAVASDQQGPFVYVVDRTAAGLDSLQADGRIERRPVQTGDLTPEGLVVDGDLRPDETVVTAGLSKLRDGDPVRITRLLTDR
jgi:RND family efflux transporter MFP subunit